MDSRELRLSETDFPNYLLTILSTMLEIQRNILIDRGKIEWSLFRNRLNDFILTQILLAEREFNAVNINHRLTNR